MKKTYNFLFAGLYAAAAFGVICLLGRLLAKDADRTLEGILLPILLVIMIVGNFTMFSYGLKKGYIWMFSLIVLCAADWIVLGALWFPITITLIGELGLIGFIFDFEYLSFIYILAGICIGMRIFNLVRFCKTYRKHSANL